MPIIPVQPTMYAIWRGIVRATPNRSVAPSRSRPAAANHSIGSRRERRESAPGARKLAGSSPGHRNRYAAYFQAGTSLINVRLHVSHLQPTKMTAASVHIRAQRGQLDGTNSNTRDGPAR